MNGTKKYFLEYFVRYVIISLIFTSVFQEYSSCALKFVALMTSVHNLFVSRKIQKRRCYFIEEKNNKWQV